jgi:hypothetical protein
MRRTIHDIPPTVVEAYADIFRHSDVPGYKALSWVDRCSLNMRALKCFLCSAECLRLLLYLLVWLLAGFNIAWQLDLRDSAAAMPLLLACLWLWPWVASARWRWISFLLADDLPSP